MMMRKRRKRRKRKSMIMRYNESNEYKLIKAETV